MKRLLTEWILPVLFGAVVITAVVLAVVRPKCGPATPPVTATTADTVYAYTDTGKVAVVTFRDSPKLAKRIAALEADNAGLRKSLYDLTGYANDLALDNSALVDSLTAARLGKLAAMLEVKVSPRRVEVVTLDNGNRVGLWSGRADRKRWRVVSEGPTGKPRIVQSRVPIDLGWFIGGRLDTPPTDWQPEVSMGAGVLARFGRGVEASVGPRWDGKAITLGATVEWRGW